MSSPTQYIDFQPNSQPGFLQGEVSRNWGSAFGYTKDLFIETTIAGVEARFINVCPVDALAFHGLERGLPRYIGETDTQYRNRLVNAWNIWTFAGTEYGILLNLAFAGFNAFNQCHIYENADWGSDPTTWWKFWVLIDDTSANLFGGLSFTIGDGTLIGDGHLIGFGTNPPNESSIKKIVQTWKPAHTKCEKIIVLLQGWVIGQAGITIGDGHTIGAVTATLTL